MNLELPKEKSYEEKEQSKILSCHQCVKLIFSCFTCSSHDSVCVCRGFYCILRITLQTFSLSKSDILLWILTWQVLNVVHGWPFFKLAHVVGSELIAVTPCLSFLPLSFHLCQQFTKYLSVLYDISMLLDFVHHPGFKLVTTRLSGKIHAH